MENAGWENTSGGHIIVGGKPNGECWLIITRNEVEKSN